MSINFYIFFLIKKTQLKFLFKNVHSFFILMSDSIKIAAMP